MSHTAQTDADPTHSPELEIRVLGPLEVMADGQPLVVDTRKALAILVLLAVEARPFARDELAAMLWPESDDASARGALRRTLSVLRTALGGRWMTSDRSNVSMAGSPWVDLRLVEEAVGSRDITRLTAASRAARGPFLAGFTLRDSPEFDDWRATRGVAAERAVSAVLEELAALSETGGDLAAAVTTVRRQVELDPLDEPAQRRLIDLLARSGDRSGAIRQYRSLVSLLERELGVAPLSETTELYEAVRDGRVAEAAGSRVLETESPGTGEAAAGGHATDIVASRSQQAFRLPMVGRDHELDLVRTAQSQAMPDGRLILVAGEAGIGKSRLTEEMVAAATAEGSVALVARAFPSEDGIPYAPVADLIRAGLRRPGSTDALLTLGASTLAELARLMPLPTQLASAVPDVSAHTGDEPVARSRLLEAISTTLAALVAGPLPGIIAVEDVQWLDDASAEALAYLGRRLVGRSLAIVVTYRPEDLDDAATSMVAALGGLPGSISVMLRRLDRADVATLIAAATSLGAAPIDADRLSAESEGLPLYVVEAMAAGQEGLAEGPPRGVRALLRERLSTVGEAATQILSAAAVIGRAFDAAMVRVASGRSEDETITALEELVHRGIVREVQDGRGDGFDFAHARLREAAYERTSFARRRLLHRRVADALRAEQTGRDDPGRMAMIAGHLRAAGLDSDAADAYRLAGARARTLYANDDALAHLETALALGHPDVRALQVEIGELLMIRGDYAGAIVALEAAAALASDPELPGVELRLGRVHARRGDMRTAASHLDAAIDGLESDADPIARVLTARALVERAVVAMRSGDPETAMSAANRALALAETAADDQARGAAYRVLGLLARERGDLAAARSALRNSLQLSMSSPAGGNDSAAIAARNALALVEAEAGEHAAAIELLDDALEACRRTGDRHLEAAIENNLADQLHAVGRSEDAMAHLKRAVALFADVGGAPGELEPEIWKLVAW
jgi:DNA-binding SARP family transcriptional activator/tetratricopeptide (TPR) repeat protein